MARLWGGAAIFLNASAFAAIVDYPSAVQALSPNHYYRLNETVMGAVSDIGSTPLPAAHEGSFPPAEVGVDGPPDLPGLTPGNRALFDNNSGGVRLGPGSSFANDTMSVALWFLGPGGVGTGDRLFTNNIERLAGGTQDSFQITLPNSASAWGIVFTTGQEADMQLALPNGVFPVQNNQWHHVVVARNGDDVNLLTVVVDGVDYSDVLTPTDVTWGTSEDNAHLGLRGNDGGGDYNHNGSIDEVAIWLGRALTVQEAQGLYNAASIPEPATAALLLLGGAAMFRMRRVVSRN